MFLNLSVCEEETYVLTLTKTSVNINYFVTFKDHGVQTRWQSWLFDRENWDWKPNQNKDFCATPCDSSTGTNVQVN